MGKRGEEMGVKDWGKGEGKADDMLKYRGVIKREGVANWPAGVDDRVGVMRVRGRACGRGVEWGRGEEKSSGVDEGREEEGFCGVDVGRTNDSDVEEDDDDENGATKKETSEEDEEDEEEEIVEKEEEDASAAARDLREVDEMEGSGGRISAEERGVDGEDLVERGVPKTRERGVRNVERVDDVGEGGWAPPTRPEGGR
jgi:hypothetical protein